MARGAYRHTVTFQAPAPPVPDGDGSFTQTWADLTPPTWRVSVTPTATVNLERSTQGTVLAMASHVVRGDYRADVTTQARMLFDGRTFAIVGTVNLDERSVTMELGVVEVVP